MKNFLSHILPIFFVFLFLNTQAQNEKPEKRNSLTVLPILFNTPETSWGFGAGSIYAFRFKNEPDSLRPSQVTLGFAYTLKKQILSYFNYQLFLKQEKYLLYGEFGYFRYVFNFYGVGNTIDPDFEEAYDVAFPRIRATALMRLNESWYVGPRIWFDDFQITDRAPDGLLIQDGIVGNNGGKTLGIGAVAIHDTRDHIFYPRKGKYIELATLFNSKGMGSDYNFQKYSIDYAQYFDLKRNQILAFNLYGVATTGTVPFQEMALIGGTKKMRGYYEGRFRDNHLLMVQTEYRFPVFWRFKGVVFGSTGLVSDTWSNFQIKHLRYTVGAGLRFLLSKKEQIHLRLDYGIGKNTSGFYLTFGEAF